MLNLGLWISLSTPPPGARHTLAFDKFEPLTPPPPHPNQAEPLTPLLNLSMPMPIYREWSPLAHLRRTQKRYNSSIRKYTSSTQPNAPRPPQLLFYSGWLSSLASVRVHNDESCCLAQRTAFHSLAWPRIVLQDHFFFFFQ